MMNTSVQTKEEFLSIIEGNQNKIKTLGVKKLGLFGSFVRGEQSLDRIIRVLFTAKPHLIENLTFVSFHPTALSANKVFMDVGFKPPSNRESGESHINL